MTTSNSRLTQRAHLVLVAWTYDLIDDHAVMAWADRVFVETERPGDLPDWLYALCSKGPSQCRQLPHAEFTFEWPRRDPKQTFLLELAKTDLDDRASLERFIRIAMDCMGEDLDLIEVQIGYYFDHLVCDCDHMDAAIAYARAELPKHMEEAQALKTSLLREIDIQGVAISED